jgi:hypothetical protein
LNLGEVVEDFLGNLVYSYAEVNKMKMQITDSSSASGNLQNNKDKPQPRDVNTRKKFDDMRLITLTQDMVRGNTREIALRYDAGWAVKTWGTGK